MQRNPPPLPSSDKDARPLVVLHDPNRARRRIAERIERGRQKVAAKRAMRAARKAAGVPS